MILSMENNSSYYSPHVEVPLSPSAVFARVGDDVVMPCFGRVDWLGSEAEMVQWKRDWKVLELVKGSLYVDPQFEGRVSLSKERILQDNISLELKSTHHEDQGLYECSFVKDQAVRLTAQINLTVTDHMTWLKVGLGSSVHLPLHSASPVIVRFLPDGAKHPVQVCEVEKGQVKCGAPYSHRTGLNNQSLELKNLSMEDSGTFSVMERETQHTVSVIFINVLPPGDTVVQADSVTVWIILISTVLFVLISIFTIKSYLKWRRGRQGPEVHPLNHTDATGSKSSTNNVQPTNSII
ncbi:hypothetical protein NFI96_020781 [Prochilodus magdalenae]|nr:hypothetical protein NFI96_020781 [Prochilodus magdalenae]